MKRRSSRVLSAVLAFTLLFTTVFSVSAAEEKATKQGTCEANATTYNIYPIPQSITYSGDVFELKDVAIVAEAGVDKYTIDFLKEVLADYDVTYTEAQAAQSGKTNIMLGIEGSDGVVDQYADGITVSNTSLYEQNDAYMLDAKEDYIVIEGKDVDSVFYGVATLQMMFSSFAAEKFLEAHVEDYATVATRGYIEGFYGAWTFEERENLMRFARDYKMNSYVYAAKGDAYHTNKWADLYPADTLAQLEQLVKVGEETKVKFGWSIHLGSFFGTFSSTSDANYATQYKKLTDKLDQLIGIGVKKIDVLNDDFGSGSHETVVEVLNQINTYLKSKGCEPLTYCPQGYNKAWSGNGAELEALKKLDADINIYWTGDDVNAPITQSTVDFLTGRSGHAPDYWLNYPVNEHAKSGIFLGDITYYARDNVTGLAGFHSNPCRYAYANEVGLYQLAALVWNNNNYSQHAQEVWESAFDYLQPEVKDSYFKIASNIANAPNSSRVPGFNETEYLAEELAAVEALVKEGASLKTNAQAQALLKEFKDIIAAIADFRENCANQDLVSELDPWLKSLDDIAHAGEAALESLIAMEDGDASTGWEKLSAASKAYDTAYSYRAHPTDLEGTYAKAGSKRLYPFVGKMINAAKNELTPLLNPSDDTINPVLCAVLGGVERSADANGLKMYDGDEATCTTWNVVQQQGDYFGLDLGREVPVRDIKIVQGTTDADHDIFHKARLEYSSDGKTWTTLVDNSDGAADGHLISVDNLEIRARYVRYYLVATGTASKPDYWTHVREFTVNKKVVENDRIYTNVETLKETPLTIQGAEVSVRDLNNVTLQAGEYVGIKLVTPTAVTAFAKEFSGTGLTLEYSYNESTWTEAGELSQPVGVKYLRLINKTDAAVQANVTKIGMTLKHYTAEPTMLTTTTTGLSQGSYENIFDGDYTTYVLTKGSQVNNTHITFDLGKTIEVNDITAVTTDGAERFYNAKIQISTDNATWTDVATVANDNSVFEVPYRYVYGDGNGADARYLRILFTGANSNALKLHEIQINANVDASAATSEIVSSMTGNLNAAIDNDIATLFAATAKAGDFVEYRISENTNVTQVSVLQGEAGTGKAYAITANGKQLLGTLDKSVSVFDPSAIAPVTAIRIEWTGAEDVAIHEISVSRGKDASDDIGVYVEPIIVTIGELPFTNIAPIASVTVSGTSDGNKDNVNDNDKNTKWDSNAIKSGQNASAQDTGDAWVSLDFGTEKTYEMNKIVVSYFNKIYPTSWVIQVSDDGSTWNDACDTITKADNGPTYPVETIEFDEAITGRYVRLYFNTVNTAAAGNGVGVQEIEVYGREKQAVIVDVTALEELLEEAEVKVDSANYTVASKAALAEAIEETEAVIENAVDQAEVTAAVSALQDAMTALQVKMSESQNIALNKPVTVSGTSNGVKESINDGNASSKWDSDLIKLGQGDSATDIGDAWAVIDLGTQTNLIDGVKVSYFNKVYPTEYEIQVSNDNATWTTVEAFSKAHNGPTHPVDEVEFDVPVSARYVRFFFAEVNNVAAGHGIGINEAEIIGRYVYEDVSVSEVNSIADVVVEENGTFDAAELPELAGVKVQVKELPELLSVLVPVSWNAENVDVTAPATYTVKGTLSLNDIDNTAAKEAVVNVIVNGSSVVPPTLVYTELDEQLSIALTKDGEADKYTPNTYSVFKTAFDAAKEVRATATSQEAINNAKTALANAIAQLKERADKSALEAKIAEAEAVDADKYTNATYAELAEAVQTAYSVKEDANATEAQVAAAVQAITEAIAGLKEKPVVVPVDKAELTAVIAEVADKDENDYTAESWAALEAALEAAEDVKADADATQAEVDAALDALQDAIAALEEKTEEPEQPVDPEDPEDPEKPDTDDKEEDKSPVTGDTAMVAPMTAILMMGMAMMVYAIRKK